MQKTGVNGVKIGSIKSISLLQMSHFFVVANILYAHESQQCACPQTTNTILAFG